MKTFKEVVTFLEKEINKEYTFEAIFEGENEIDTEDFNEVVQKIDLDNNGTTDVIIDYIGDPIFILDRGHNVYKEIKMLDVNRVWEGEELTSMVMKQIDNKTIFIREIKLPSYTTEKSKNIIIKKNQKDVVYDRKTNKATEVIRDRKFRVDTLEVKFGDFVASNPNKKKIKNKIKEIHFEATPCYGSCPVFELKITSDGNLEYHGKQSTNFIGRKKLKLDATQLEELFGLIEYMDVKSLKDRYAVNATDNPSGNLKVVFKNGDIKEIYDYGRFGTYNLRVVYKKLMQISDDIK
ncbi:DUF6438 domain-containing protein [uncultured Kordia sp.]|uniref:DUF6438 domain-containing protein n=1 Tax=uncultured Kordia sp. TaxID=507699 RepID=UPI002615E3BD|nr:DUF6438 domain-containing protein [uncultured Kordia sp.]